MDGLPGAKLEAFAENPHFLAPQAGEMHLDPAQLAMVEGVMLERAHVEIGAELAVDADEGVAIELSRDPLGIVVGGVEHLRGLGEVEAPPQSAGLPHPAFGT